MKIYILPVDKKFQPEKQANIYPPHNDDFGVEQDFYKYLLNNKDLLTDNKDEADWHYLPVYWTRWHVNHGYGKEGLGELQKETDKILINSKKTFTICQYDDGPMVDLKGATIFLSSRKVTEGIDIPLLSNVHKSSEGLNKKYLTSFIGNIGSHSIRPKMADALKNIEGVYIFDSHKKRNFLSQKLMQIYFSFLFGNRTKFFIQKTLQSYVSLCPRGYGGSSFRFFEAMQLGVVPFLVGDIDTRPFKSFIDWDKISFYTNDPKNIVDIIHSVDENKLIEMGKEAKKVYEEKLAYQKWCPLVFEELKNHAR